MEVQKKIKVLLVSPYSTHKVGGIGTWSKIIVDYCKNNNDVVLYYQNTKFFLKHSVHNNNVKRIVTGALDTSSILIKLFFNCLIYNPDIIHYTSSASLALRKDIIAIFIVRRIFHKKFVIHWRFGRIPELCALKNKEYKLLIKVINKADISIVIDDNSYNSLKNLGIDNIVNIPNPISQPLRILSETLNMHRLASGREVGSIVFVGHIIQSKGIYELVRVCKDLECVKKLTMIGPYTQQTRESLLAIARERGEESWVFLPGELKRENVFNYYQKYNVFCLPSYTEGFPNVVLEAMANACPIVATEVGAVPEMLSQGCGICIDPQNEEQLRDALFQLLNDKDSAIEMGIRARRKVLEQYTIDKVFSQYLYVWRATL